MKSRSVLLLPLCALGLVSCMPDSYPKSLSYAEAINYVKANSKGEKNPKEGWLDYSCKSAPSVDLESLLVYLGADDVNPFKQSDKKQLDSTIHIKKYLNESKDISTSSNPIALPLMYLTENNFQAFVDDGKNFTFKLTYVKEFIMSTSDNENTTYIRYYNTSLNLTRFEIKNPDNNSGYDILQTYLYN